MYFQNRIFAYITNVIIKYKTGKMYFKFDSLDLTKTIEGDDDLLDIDINNLTDDLYIKSQNYTLTHDTNSNHFSFDEIEFEPHFKPIPFPPEEDVHYLWTKPAPKRKTKSKSNRKKSSPKKKKQKTKRTANNICTVTILKTEARTESSGNP